MIFTSLPAVVGFTKTLAHLFSILTTYLPKPKKLLWSIITDVDSTMDQSEIEANTCNRRQARENACERGMVGFSFVSHWLRNWREFW